MKTYYVWLHNQTSRLDDEPKAFKAKSEDEAKELASKYDRGRYRVGYTCTNWIEFCKWTGWPKSLKIVAQ